MKNKPEPSIEQQKVSSQLIEMAKQDQKARLTRSKDLIDPVDKANQEVLLRIIEKYGWPSMSQFGKEAAHSAWLIAQHADSNPELQRRCLELMQNDESISQEDLGYLADRVRVNEGRPQLFGTQWTIENDEFKPNPIEDEENLEKRRAEIGMPPFDEYAKEMRQQYQTWKDSQQEDQNTD